MKVAVRALILPLLALWPIAGCESETIAFRSEQAPSSVPAPAPNPAPVLDAGAGTTEASAPMSQPDAQAGPFVSEFDFSEPRSGGDVRRPTSSTSSPFTPSCDAGVCTCRTSLECPTTAPVCDYSLGVCTQCVYSRDCHSASAAVCDRGECRGCFDNGECPTGWECQDRTCVEFCQDSRDCLPGWSCQGGVCADDQTQLP
jgi:hypothetical protein